ncbi:hypothetical protein F4678DRAFT_444517 [Xylaria arbuscula]|nr:hypothetical protein F4678DRAFT_444517 [Xylaria arbuscula]
MLDLTLNRSADSCGLEHRSHLCSEIRCHSMFHPGHCLIDLDKIVLCCRSGSRIMNGLTVIVPLGYAISGGIHYPLVASGIYAAVCCVNGSYLSDSDGAKVTDTILVLDTSMMNGMVALPNHQYTVLSVDSIKAYISR